MPSGMASAMNVATTSTLCIRLVRPSWFSDRKPYSRAINAAVSAMVSRLVMYSINAPPKTVQLSVARPKPTAASGGIRAVAMATPTIVPSRPRIIA